MHMAVLKHQSKGKNVKLLICLSFDLDDDDELFILFFRFCELIFLFN